MGKKDGDYCPVINLKILNQFQNGRPLSVKALNTGGRLDLQTGTEGCILQCPIGSKLEKVLKVSVKVDSL